MIRTLKMRSNHKTVWRRLKKWKTEVLNDPAILLLGIDSKNWNQNLEETLAFPHLLEHYSQYSRGGNSLNIHQQMSGLKKMHTVEYYSTLEKENRAIWDHTNEMWEQYANWNEPVTERQILCDSIYIQSSQSHRIREWNAGCQRLEHR